MYHFNVEDMTCGHCVATVEKFVKTVERKTLKRLAAEYFCGGSGGLAVWASFGCVSQPRPERGR
ncbi:hypothetical protein GOC59_27650 [Sinorhizobium medicae]|nr:hypothetical protein [Sinorhizobium medicae]